MEFFKNYRFRKMELTFKNHHFSRKLIVMMDASEPLANEKDITPISIIIEANIISVMFPAEMSP